MICIRSVRLIEALIKSGRYNPNLPKPAADEGTAAHQIRGDALDLDLDAWDFVGDKILVNGTEYECDDDMARHLQGAIDWIREQPGKLIVEYRVDLSKWMPGQFGTLDTAIIWVVGRKLIVLDLKYGAGVEVFVEFTKQLRIYGLGIVDNFDLYDDIDEIEFVIDQPRLGGMKHWSCSLDDLLAFGEEVRAAAALVDDPDAPWVASEKGCQWCPVKDQPEGCGAYTRWMNDLTEGALLEMEDFDLEPEFSDPAIITPERRFYIVKHATLMKKWLAKLHEDSMAAAEAGKPDPGSKLVAGQRSDRRYTDPSEAEVVLVCALGEDGAFTRKLKSPTQAEKDLKPGKKKVGNADAWKELSDLITQDDGRPILASVDDPRPALTPIQDALDEMDDLD